MTRLFILLICVLTAPTSFAAERSVTDDAGRTVTMPASPERIIVLHEPLIGVPLAELGLPPVGSYGRNDDGGTQMAADFYRLVLGDRAPDPLPRGIGALGNMDLEKMRSLEPDLIIGTEHDLEKAELLSAIAPVYLQNSSTGRVRGFNAEESLAGLLGLEAAFEDRKAAYLARLEAVRAALPKDPREQDYLVIFLSDQINAVGEMAGMVQALEDLGYSRLSPDRDSTVSGFGATLLVPLSAEVFGRLDPDLLVVMNSFGKNARDEAAIRQSLDRIVPGWQHFLKPAREGRILFVDSALVTTPTVASAMHMLDAIESWAKK
ncbi:ABC transporter substrate-binding protein [Nisaea acidiphila]|uniref:ABC transporter substrate-binding protein n=1 Tax=Nisaea acidiphila TaxID=1862145 RepID=A0A9J7AQ36_9PROT|nr:ABC transporter substrate-binding protein [Nisaea acidiphila]UUX49278.1 ABC transporter substrate-binding protein [Nisaea acidiphila]